jgi:hypothetical protein
MSSFLILLIAAAGTSSLCACSAETRARPPETRPLIVIQHPKGEQGDFTICNDGRVLVFPVAHPKSCS